MSVKIFLKKEKIFLKLSIIIVFLSIVDALSTYYAVSYFGEKESMPVAYSLMRILGFNEVLIFGTIIKIAGLILFAMALNKMDNYLKKPTSKIPDFVKRIPIVAITLVTIFYAFIVINNIVRIIA